MTRSDVSAVVSLTFRNDSHCQGASQQMANGFYRIVELLSMIANDLDEKGTRSSSILAVQQLLNRNNSYCQGAPQQAANGAYRMAELLEIILGLLDENGVYSSSVQSIVSLMNRNNSYCQGASQQSANGIYRIAEMLQILTHLVAEQESSSVSGIISAMNRCDSRCQGAPQQGANGTEAVFYILQRITVSLDKGGRYLSQLQSIVTIRERNNARCQGADQQSANNLYRIIETLQVLTNIMLDEAEQRIREYWQEHPEERQALLQEQSECEEKIRAIKAEAAAIHGNEKLDQLRKEIKDLEQKRNAWGMEELKALEKNVEALRAERSAIGLFKFSLRKEATAKINDAVAVLEEKKREVQKGKDAVQRTINGCKGKISDIEKDVKARQDAVLAGCKPYEERLQYIDWQFKRKR